MITNEEIRKEIVAILVDELFLNENEPIGDDSKLREDLGVESLDELMIEFSIQRRFGIKNLKLKIEEIPTVKDLVNYTELKIQEAVLAAEKASLS